MPFLTLRECKSLGEDVHASLDETWPEVATFHTYCDAHAKVCKYVIREANVSVVICGWSHSKWVCWALSNTHSDPTTRNEDPADEDDFFKEDHIATDGNGPADGRAINTEEPIWCARRYWLQTVDVRMRIVHREWMWLVRSIEEDVKAWVRSSLFGICDRTNICCRPARILSFL